MKYSSETKTHGSIRTMKSGGAAGVVLGLAAVGLAMGTSTVSANEKVVDANQPKVRETGVEVKESTIKNETPTGNASTNLNAPAGAISDKQKADLGNENKVTGETPVTIDHTKVQEEAKNAEQVGVNVVQDKTQVAPTTSTAEDTAKAVKSITAKETEKSNELKSTATAHSTAVSNWVDQKNSTVAFNNELDKAHLKAVESYNDFIKTLDADTASVVAQHKDAIIKVTEVIQKTSDGTSVEGYQSYIRSLAEQQGINKESIKDYLVKKAEYNSKSTANSETVVRNLSNSTRIDAENKAKSQSVDAENTRRSTSAQKVVEENTAKSNSTVAENNRLSTSAKTENERRSNSAKAVENDNNAKSLSVKAENEKRSNSAKAENERRSNSAEEVKADNLAKSNSVVAENNRRSNSAKDENARRSNSSKDVENDNIAKSNSVVKENERRSNSAKAENTRRSNSAKDVERDNIAKSNSVVAENIKRSNSAKDENARRSNSAKDVEADNVAKSNSVVAENNRRSNSAKAENERRSSAVKKVEDNNRAKSLSVVAENNKRSQSAEVETAKRSQSAAAETAKRSNSAKAENERRSTSAEAVKARNLALSESVKKENDAANSYNRRIMASRKLPYTGDWAKDSATVDKYNKDLIKTIADLEAAKITGSRVHGSDSDNYFSGKEPTTDKSGVDWANNLVATVKGVSQKKDTVGVSLKWQSNSTVEMISGGEVKDYKKEVAAGHVIEDRPFESLTPYLLRFTGATTNNNGLYSKTMTFRLKNVGSTSKGEPVDAIMTATAYMSEAQKNNQSQLFTLGTNDSKAIDINYFGFTVFKLRSKIVYSGTNDAVNGSYSGLIADVDWGQTSSITVDGKITTYNPDGSELTYSPEINGYGSEYKPVENINSAPKGVYLFTGSGSTIDYLHGNRIQDTKGVIRNSSIDHGVSNVFIEFALFGEAQKLPSTFTAPLKLKPLKTFKPEKEEYDKVTYTPATYEKATYTPVTFKPETPPKYEPVSYEKVTYTPGNTDWKPVIYEKVTFTPRSTEWASVGYEKVNFTPKDTSWQPVGYEKVTFTPRSTEWTSVGYEKVNFTPEDTSWTPVGYTPVKFTPKNTNWNPVPYVPTPYVPEKLPEVPKEPVLEVAKPTAPADPVFHKIPKEPKVPTVHYHLTALNENTPVEKLAQNENGVNINNESVAKNSTNHFILKPKALPAGRPITTSIVLSDYIANGLELDIAGMQKVNKSWDISYNASTRLLEVKGVSSEYEKANADRTIPYTPTAFTIIYKAVNDGATYENVFKMDINGGSKGDNPNGYTSYSNRVRIHTPGSPNNPNDPRNPNGGGNHKIQPVKNNTNKEGQNINNKALLQTDVNYYVAEWDLDQYINDKSSKSAIAKGFGYLENYPEKAVTPITKDYYAVTSKGEKVEGLDFYEADSSKLNELPEFVQQFIKDSGIDISNFGKFHVWMAKDSQAFYDKYVKTGQDIFFHMPMSINKGFTGKYENQTYQIDFGNGYYGNVVHNNVPNLTPKKDVVVDGKSANGGTITYGQEFSYLLSGAKLPSNRGSHVWEYRYIDDYDQTGDKYLGKYKVVATTDITVSQLEEVKEDTTFKEDVTLEDRTVVKAGQKVSKGLKVRRTHVIKTGEDVTKFTEAVHDEAKGILTISFKEDFLKTVVDSSEFGADASIEMKRIAYGEFYNKYTNRVNGVDYISNTVKTTTPKPPTPEQPAPKQPQLPSTGTSESSASMVGMAILSVLGLAGLHRRRNQ